MKLPHLSHMDLRIQRAQNHTLEYAVHTGMEALHKATRTLMARASTTSSSASTCTKGDNSALCQKPTNTFDDQTLPIILGAA